MGGERGCASEETRLGRAPLVGLLLIAQMAHAGDKRRMAIFPSPFDCFPLSFRGVKHMIGVIFDLIIGDRFSIFPAFRARFHIDVRHFVFLRVLSQHAFIFIARITL